MLIRHATTSDTDVLVELIRQLGYEITRDALSANLHIYNKTGGYVFVSEEEEQVTGFISGSMIPLFHMQESMFRITALCVHEQYREKGVGKELVLKVEELCRKKECFQLEVTSGAHRNKEAHLFYESLGYTAYKGKRFTKKLDSVSTHVR